MSQSVGVPRLEELRQRLEQCRRPAEQLHLQAALALAEQKPGLALRLIEESLRLEADFSARNTRAVCLLSCGQKQEATAALLALLEERPDHADLWLNLGRARNNPEDLHEALRLRPGWLPARLLLARCLADQQRTQEALALLGDATEPAMLLLEVRILSEAGRHQEAAGRLLDEWPGNDEARHLLIRVLSSAQVLIRHPNLPQRLLESSGVAGALDLFPAALRLWPDHLELLLTLLSHGQVCDLALERRLAAWRRQFRNQPEPGPLAEALAIHNFTHEFAMLEEPDELEGLTPEHPAYPLYRPLPPGTAAPEAVLECQVRQPQREQKLRLRLRADPGIDRVRQQYEENPYPRWRSLGVGQEARPFHQVMSQLFPDHGCAPVDEPTILIAGCGTGRHALSSARRYAGARTWAIDFSLTSLAYALRQAGEDSPVQFRWADLLHLDQADLPDSFDIIESVGVLHHLEQPLTGLLALRRRLAPQGWMRLGLYSARFRSRFARARALARQLAPGRDLRQVRRLLVEQLPAPDLEALASTVDFYSLSGLRDLLLHERELEYDLDGVWQLMESANLEIIGFEGSAQQWGSDRLAWQRFEEENPTAFKGMYVFWCRKQR